MDQKGEVKFLTIVLIVGIVVGIYFLVLLFPGAMRNYQIQHTIETAAKFYVDPVNHDGVQVYLMKKISEMELPITVEDIKIEDDGETVRIYLDWEKEVTFIPANPVVPPVIRTYKYHNEAVEELKH
jgi:hypothetical protein